MKPSETSWASCLRHGAFTDCGPAFQTYEQPQAAAGHGRTHGRLRSTHAQNCSGEVTLVSADRLSISRTQDHNAIPGSIRANAERRTIATRAPSMNTSTKVQGRACVSRRNKICLLYTSDAADD